MSNHENECLLDPEWVQLLHEAKAMGITVQEIRTFIELECEKFKTILR